MQFINSKTGSKNNIFPIGVRPFQEHFFLKGSDPIRSFLSLWLVVVALLFVSGCSGMIHVREVAPPAEIPTPKKSLTVGEKLTYRITWIGIPVGTISSYIKEVAEIKGRKTYHIELTANTNDFCSAIYRIDDSFATYIDTETFLPLRHELKREEGRHRKNYIIEYDHEKHTATYYNLIEQKTTTMDVPAGVQDPLSAIYYFRTKDVAVGDEIYMDVNMNEKNYETFGKIERKTIVEVPELGTFEAFESRPFAKHEGKLVKKGRAWGYISCSEDRIPLFGVVDVWVRLIGRVALTLQKVEYLS